MIAADHARTRADCRHAIAHHAYESPAHLLRAAAEHVAESDRDNYGAGEGLAAFERTIAAVLGKAAAVFMPSGTMAQQIALRIVAERRANRAFAAHATNHVVLHERDGYALLHGLRFIAAGAPERLITLDDLCALREPFATLLLELPQREIGGQLPAWDDLVALTGELRAQGVHLHLDGARLWECGPFYGRPYAEIGALFDSVYVSFYKGIGAPAGAMLAGTAAFIDEARIWQRRHGGNLVTMFPYSALAERAFSRRIGRMAAYRAGAERIARAFERYPEIAVVPSTPHTNMLHAFVAGPADELLARAQHVARELGVWTIGRLGATVVPNRLRWEISCGDATLALDDELLAAALAGLFAR